MVCTHPFTAGVQILVGTPWLLGGSRLLADVSILLLTALVGPLTLLKQEEERRL